MAASVFCASWPEATPVLLPDDSCPLPVSRQAPRDKGTAGSRVAARAQRLLRRSRARWPEPPPRPGCHPLLPPHTPRRALCSGGHAGQGRARGKTKAHFITVQTGHSPGDTLASAWPGAGQCPQQVQDGRWTRVQFCSQDHFASKMNHRQAQLAPPLPGKFGSSSHPLGSQVHHTLPAPFSFRNQIRQEQVHAFCDLSTNKTHTWPPGPHLELTQALQEAPVS